MSGGRRRGVADAHVARDEGAAPRRRRARSATSAPTSSASVASVARHGRAVRQVGGARRTLPAQQPGGAGAGRAASRSPATPTSTTVTVAPTWRASTLMAAPPATKLATICPVTSWGHGVTPRVDDAVVAGEHRHGGGMRRSAADRPAMAASWTPSALDLAERARRLRELVVVLEGAAAGRDVRQADERAGPPRTGPSAVGQRRAARHRHRRGRRRRARSATPARRPRPHRHRRRRRAASSSGARAEPVQRSQHATRIGLGGADVTRRDDDLEQLRDAGADESGSHVGLDHHRGVGDGTDPVAAGERPQGRHHARQRLADEVGDWGARRGGTHEGAADVEEDGGDHGRSWVSAKGVGRGGPDRRRRGRRCGRRPCQPEAGAVPHHHARRGAGGPADLALSTSTQGASAASATRPCGGEDLDERVALTGDGIAPARRGRSWRARSGSTARARPLTGHSGWTAAKRAHVVGRPRSRGAGPGRRTAS